MIITDRESIRLYTALSYHLAGNIYPPVPSAFIPVAIDAINRCNSGDWDGIIALPDGCTINGSNTTTAGKVVDDLRLDEFLN